MKVTSVKVEFLHRKEIDDRKWDEAIARSTAETLYPYSWYLDAAADNWSALVMDNYRFVMPLIWKKKYGLRYLYHPYYTQQLGVFSNEYVDPTLIKTMLRLLMKKYRFAIINFNTKNLIGEEEPFTVDDKTNYVLDLHHGYEKLYAAFSTNAKRNVKKANALNEVVEKNISIEELINFKRGNDVIKRTREEYLWLVNLLETTQKNSGGSVYAAKSEGELCAAAFFGFSRSRAIYLVSASNSRGKEDRSMFKIVDAFIKELAGSELILDFEGSNIPNVARFFAGFGARPEIYQGVSFSRIPLFLTRLRKNG